MRIGAVWDPVVNAHYRARDPLRAMERRGHQVIWPPTGKGEADRSRLSACDVVHVYRRHDDATLRVLKDVARSGVGIVFDNDDDMAGVPRESVTYREVGGFKGERMRMQVMKVARLARVVTTTSERLAEQYRASGAASVHVVDNMLDLDVARPRPGHDGIVVGWVAAAEHAADAARLGLEQAFERLLEARPEVRVETIGVPLRLSQRHRNDEWVNFWDLPPRVGGFDIGIAPLADTAFNRGRSDIKVKEYAASGVPWLASPVGPYARLGEKEGGRLVPDDRWFDELDRLVAKRRERSRLAKRGLKWAQTQGIDAAADRWERAYAEAAAAGA